MLKTFLLIIFILFSDFVLPKEGDVCGNNTEAIKLVNLIKSDLGQQRTTIRCNKLLADAALAKATNMASQGLVSHNLDGSPNTHLRKFNYKLPSYYGNKFNSNQVEAIAGGYASAENVWYAFKKSKLHREHLLGEIDFYKEQDEIGVAFLYEWNSPHVEYWVVYLTKGYEKNQVNINEFEKIPNKNIFILEPEIK